MLLKLFRSIVIGLIVAGLLLVVMPSLRQFNKLSAPQFDSADETPATYNQAVRRAAPAVVNVYNRGLNSSAHNQLEIRTLGSGVIRPYSAVAGPGRLRIMFPHHKSQKRGRRDGT